MPTLIGNQRKKEVETKLAKFYSMTNQAVKLAANEYGDITELGPLTKCSGIAGACTTDEAIEAFKEYFGKYIQYSKIEPNSTDDGFIVYLNDGSVWTLKNYIRDMGFHINSKALENSKGGVNSFTFRFAPEDLREMNKYHSGKGVEPYAYYWDGTPEDLKAGALGGANYGCNGTVSSYCAKLIQMNGWKIPKDYPYKF